MMNVAVDPLFYIGAELHFVGTGEAKMIAAENRIDWEECEIPERMAAGGAPHEVPVRVRNIGDSTWGMRGARQVSPLTLRCRRQWSGCRFGTPHCC
jgi:hypothetical protein